MAFLGALVVITTLLVLLAVDNTRLGWKDLSQTWIAALLCLLGVVALELGRDSGPGPVNAVGVGICFLFIEKMMVNEPG